MPKDMTYQRNRTARPMVLLCVIIATSCNGEPARCESCDLVLEDAVVLEDVGYTMSTKVVRTRGGGYAAIETNAGAVVRFDRRGRLVRTVERHDRDGADYRALQQITLGNADSIFLLDGGRVYVLDANLNPVRTVRTPVSSDIIVLPDGAIIGHVAGSRPRGVPLMYRLNPDSTQPSRLFDPQPSDNTTSSFRLLSRKNGEIWSVGRLVPEARIFDEGGTLLREFRVEHQWFDSREPDGNVRVSDAIHDSDGRLLLLIFREREGWQPPVNPNGSRVPVALSPAEFADRWEQQIVIIDSDGKVVASRAEPDAALLGFADGEHVYGYPSDGGLMRVWAIHTGAAS